MPPSIVSFVRVDADDLLPDKGDVWGQREAAQKRKRGVMDRRLRYPYRWVGSLCCSMELMSRCLRVGDELPLLGPEGGGGEGWPRRARCVRVLV